MRIVCQRVSSASVSIDQKITNSIGNGLLVFLGIEEADTVEDIQWLCGKIARLRIFDDADGTMNLSVKDIKGEILVVSQFTLHASTRKGNRPSYIKAAKSETAIPLYKSFIEKLSEEIQQSVRSGEFGSHMQIELINDGPVTIIIDSKKRE